MKHIVLKSLALTALVCTLTTTANAQQVPLPTTPGQVPGPALGPMTSAYVQTVGRMAYVWGWPLV